MDINYSLRHSDILHCDYSLYYVKERYIIMHRTRTDVLFVYLQLIFDYLVIPGGRQIITNTCTM